MDPTKFFDLFKYTIIWANHKRIFHEENHKGLEE